MRPRSAALLIASVLLGHSGAGTTAPQVITRRPVVDLSKVLGLPPEPIRSILLLHSGQNLTKANADELEADIRTTPDNVDVRLNLIGYYSWNGKTAADNMKLREHVLWMVENHPEDPATGEPSLIDLPDDPEGSAQILALWTQNMAIHGNNPAVLKNAERYFFGQNPGEADRIIHILSQRDPTNNQWPRELALLYRLCGVPGDDSKDVSEEAVDAYKRVLELTHTAEASAALAGDMAEADFKVGDLNGAAALAKIQLQTADPNAVQPANTLLGRVALRQGDRAASKQYLIDSSKAASAHNIAFFGPRMSLARELLDVGEREIVIQYLENCLTLWPNGQAALHSWISDIQNGKVPNFGNLAF